MNIKMTEIDVIIVSNAKSEAYRKMTQNAVNTCMQDSNKINVFVMEQQKNVKYTHATTINYGFDFNYNKVINEGFKHCKSEFICFCNNDLQFHENWATELIKYYPKYSSFSPFCNQSHGKGKWADVTNIMNKDGNVINHEVGRCIAGWCILVHKSVIEKIGKLDEGVEFWYSDNLYKLQIEQKEIKHILVYKSKVTHLGAGSLTLKSTNTNMNRYLTTGQTNKFNNAKNKYDAKG